MTDLLPVERDDQSLELDPVGYMSTVLHRAKSWLDEAQSIDDVRNAKAIAVGYENVIREKEMAFDAQLAATDIVRRCERRVGELVRQGQDEGTITRRGSVGALPGPRSGGQPGSKRGGDLVSTAEIFSNNAEREDSYRLADASTEEFEQAIEEAKAEGNLSRANVVRKVKGETPKPPERSEWHRGKRHINSNRIVSSLAAELDASTTGLDLIVPEDIDVETKLEAVQSINNSIDTIRKAMRKW